MPIENNVGQSENTPVKQDQFRKFLKMHLGIVKGINARYQNQSPYYFFDLNGGRGVYSGLKGSPVIFQEESELFGLRTKALVFESDVSNFEELKKNVKDSGQFILINRDNKEIGSFPGIVNKSYGLLYSDCNGGMPPWEEMGKFFQNQNHSKIDAMIYASATNIKRISRASSNAPTLVAGMEKINKRYWLIRKPADKHQWTFLVGTNWAHFPTWEKQGFYQVSSSCGQSILERLNLTAAEIEELNASKQPRLPHVS